MQQGSSATCGEVAVSFQARHDYRLRQVLSEFRWTWPVRRRWRPWRRASAASVQSNAWASWHLCVYKRSMHTACCTPESSFLIWQKIRMCYLAWSPAAESWQLAGAPLFEAKQGARKADCSMTSMLQCTFPTQVQMFDGLKGAADLTSSLTQPAQEGANRLHTPSGILARFLLRRADLLLQISWASTSY